MTTRVRDISLVAVLSIAWGLTCFEIFGINYLLPFIAPGLHLGNERIGVLISAFWVPFGLAGYFGGHLFDRVGRRKLVLLIIFGLFSIVSPLSGLTKTFAELLACRLVMGMLEGSILPILQSVIVLQTMEDRRATYMGIVQNVGQGVISGFVAPVLLVWVATHYEWRFGFDLVILPGFLCVIGLAAVVDGRMDRKAPSAAPTQPRSQRFPLKELLGERNIVLCCILAIVFVAYVLIGYAYYPLYLIRVRHLAPATMGNLMSALGIATIVMGVLVPLLADRVGRRPAAIVASLIGVLNPLIIVFWHNDLILLGVLMFLTWTPIGASILFQSTVPSESVSAQNVSSAIGLVFGISTLAGGGLGPSFAGWIGGHWGLRVSILLQASLALAMCGLSFALRETRRSTVSSAPEGSHKISVETQVP